MTNALDTWLKESKTPALHIARAVGVSAPYICDLRRDRRKPSDKVAAAIEDATGGAVPARAWLDT
jgi:DNA-binding transcriptional regulator YdaS (Cro superfamily)